MEDCLEELLESVEQLRQTLKELLVLLLGTFRWQMSNAETCVSAALTNETPDWTTLNRSPAASSRR